MAAKTKTTTTKTTAAKPAATERVIEKPYPVDLGVPAPLPPADSFLCPNCGANLVLEGGEAIHVSG